MPRVNGPKSPPLRALLQSLSVLAISSNFFSPSTIWRRNSGGHMGGENRPYGTRAGTRETPTCKAGQCLLLRASDGILTTADSSWQGSCGPICANVPHARTLGGAISCACTGCGKLAQSLQHALVQVHTTPRRITCSQVCKRVKGAYLAQSGPPTETSASWCCSSTGAPSCC